MFESNGNLYAVIKEILKMDGLMLGGVRAPLYNITEDDLSKVEKCRELICTAELAFAAYESLKSGSVVNVIK